MTFRRSSYSKRRRRFLWRMTNALGLAAAISFAGRESTAQDNELPHLSEDDPTAKALMYTEDATTSESDLRQEDAFCHNCQFFMGEEGQMKGYAGCMIFPQNQVAAEGWCSAWTKKT
jgi:hypothetical protein